MNTPFFISWRYQRSKQKNRLVSLISAFSSIGIALGVAVLIIGLSAMNGFERELNQRILAIVPHVEISAYQINGDERLQTWQNLAALLKENQEIEAVSPFVTFTALIENGTKLKVAQIKGVNKASQDNVSQIGNYVLNEGWQHFAQDGGLVLGAGIAKDLGVTEGDWVTLLLSQNNEDNKFAQPIRQRMRVSAILRLDGQLDHSYALMPLEQAQVFLNYNQNEVTGLELKVKNPFMVNEIYYEGLERYPQMLSAENWISKFGYMYNDIRLIRTVMYIAMVLVIGVACFNIISTLIMAVKDKQGDIAIMRTLGANDHFIRKIFIFYGLQVGMKGCLIGIVLGIVLALNLTEIIRSIEWLLNKKLLSDGIYFVDFLPSELHWQDIVLVFISALVLSLLASLYPSNRASKLQPAQVLSSY
ncbi:lipoprotein-releasing system permease protein [Bisgaardia hudsonensis]|uniref:Lipoprotein-releasing system permease protein n=1 Tax=Bisgaardia hudsonensis TaxID=109472 RepID=A0A4R2N0X4_9PAST|nr:lipoprotein-releasing ABC transporter permease subunit LolE [Bisgaardia hudsonensis]QLB13240.1 lipoprotein transporter subunit LolE [Bisgaardia hudsonensis]TCP13179.1 lipoprotein-releasing system permease protein [Bisgaardia hudsonensis]